MYNRNSLFPPLFSFLNYNACFFPCQPFCLIF
nr:MAG TPA: hypothetical protein [Caudoviricetes sp.]